MLKAVFPEPFARLKIHIAHCVLIGQREKVLFGVKRCAVFNLQHIGTDVLAAGGNNKIKTFLKAFCGLKGKTQHKVKRHVFNTDFFAKLKRISYLLAVRASTDCLPLLCYRGLNAH